MVSSGTSTEAVTAEVGEMFRVVSAEAGYNVGASNRDDEKGGGRWYPAVA